MANGTQSQRRRSRLSLSLRFSVLMLLAALLPVAVVVGVNDLFARQTLIQQSSDALSADANANASRIDDYFRERLLDGVALSSLETAPKLLICVTQVAAAKQAVAQGVYPIPQVSNDCANNFDAYKVSVGRALVVGTKRDSNYTEWDMFLADGQLLGSSNQNVTSATIPKSDLAAVQQGKQWVSGVYYDTQNKYAFVHIYTPIYEIFPNQGAVLGILGATIRLDKVWSIVAQEAHTNGSGNLSFITDQNGVRIAASRPNDLFTAVQPLNATEQGAIAGNQLYGAAGSLGVQNLPDVASAAKASAKQASFQTAIGDSGQFQVVGARLANLPWMYFVASPISSVTAVAAQQEKLSILSAGVVAILAALIGLFIGGRTAAPVERSAADLEGAVAILKSLASRQESSASEQHWVVDACKTGLDGVRYLADAMNQAAKRIMSASNWFNDYWDRLTEEQARATVQHLRELAAYIDEAARRQQASSDRLDKAITVTMQVSDQLLTGATEASQSASSLEQVVRDLQQVVGGRVRDGEISSDDMETLQRRVESATGAIAAVRAPMATNQIQPSTPGRPVANVAGSRGAPRAPRQAWDSPSQMGGEEWDVFGGAGQMGSSMGPSSGGYGVGARGANTPSQMNPGGYSDNGW